jgi:hypothetical protein
VSLRAPYGFVVAVVVVVVPPPPPGDVVLVLVVVVVAVGCWQTVMVTVCGNGGIKTVPAEGLSLCTVPTVPPLCEQSTGVKDGVRPGVADMAALAAPWVS